MNEAGRFNRHIYKNKITDLSFPISVIGSQSFVIIALLEHLKKG